MHINCMTIDNEANVPHSGIMRSGWARFDAEAGPDEFLRHQDGDMDRAARMWDETVNSAVQTLQARSRWGSVILSRINLLCFASTDA